MQEQNQIQIQIKDEDLKGNYSNIMQVIHTKEEFALDFFSVFPPKGNLVSRIIMSPSHLKRMIRALQENMGKYEEKFGKIEETANSESFLGFQSDK